MIKQLKKMKKASVLLAFMFLFAVGTAIAGTATTTGLESLYTEVSGWLNGAPGKIMAIGFIVVSIWQAIRGNYLVFFAGILFATVLTLVPGIVDARFTALF